MKGGLVPKMRGDEGSGQRTGLRQSIKASVRGGGKKFVRQATHPIHMAEESVRRSAQKQREDEIVQQGVGLGTGDIGVT